MAASLKYKRILVTGGTSGIGKAVAVAAARAGADVAFCGLTEEGADEAIAVIEEAGGRAFFQALDLSDLEAARRFACASIEQLGGLDGLVNNAGTNFFHGVLESTYQDIERCFSVDFYPAWAISQEAYPALKAAGGGVIINIASVHAERTQIGTFPYNASKAALVALTKSQALEWGRDNIRAVVLEPGFILTPLATAYLRSKPDPEGEFNRILQDHPLKRVGQPEDVASLAVYLLSDANRFVTGTVVTVDGGVTAAL